MFLSVAALRRWMNVTMAQRKQPRNGQKTGHRPAQAESPVGYGWADYVEALVAQHGTLAAVAWKLVDRGIAEDASSVERAIRRLRGRGQRDGGLIGRRLVRLFGMPASIESRARWMGLYHSPFSDLPVQLCIDQLRLWDRPPVSDSKARIWILLGLASVALRRRAFPDAQALLEKAASIVECPTARVEHSLMMSYLVSRLDADAARAEEVARPSLDSARRTLEESREALDPQDVACFEARLVDHEAFVANRRGDHEVALSLFRSLPLEDTHPFASYRRDAGLAYGLHRRGDTADALRLALRACDHAGDGGYVRLRAMGLLMVARIQGRPANAQTLARAETMVRRLDDPELMVRVQRAQGTR